MKPVEKTGAGKAALRQSWVSEGLGRMSSLTMVDKMKLESLFQMGGGYVLNFTNRTFQEFIFENTGKDIYDEDYSSGGGSKAYRLRGFWVREPDAVVGKLLCALLDYWKEMNKELGSVVDPKDQARYEECVEIANRLKEDSAVAYVAAALGASAEDENYEMLATAVADSIEEGHPEAALDRLHTYMVKYSRRLCDVHNIQYSRDEPLHSCWGKYVKHLTSTHLVESAMTIAILRNAISQLDAFCDVRNNRSLAHDNKLLERSESRLIVRQVSALVEFVNELESELAPGEEIGH